MQIRFTKKRLNYNLIFGILWLVVATGMVLSDADNYFFYIQYIIAILHLGTYFFERKKHYLTIENGLIIKHKLIPKKIDMQKVTQIIKIPGGYTLKTNDSKLRIDTELIEAKSLIELKSVLSNIHSGINQSNNVLS